MYFLDVAVPGNEIKNSSNAEVVIIIIILSILIAFCIFGIIRRINNNKK
jgi:hypothetical protein